MTDARYMRRALALARRGRTSPNPMVGAVVVRDGRIVGEGYHRRVGEPHAEVHALRRAGEAARDAVMYVTLEPCCHHGRTPPCTDAVVAAGIARVVAAMPDPDPKVAGKGFAKLRQAGITVESGVCEDEARLLNEAYIKHRTTGMPFVILKSAMSLDGKIATRAGDSKWITNERSRAYAHRIRSRVDAIVVGAGTVRSDDPALTARVGGKTYYPKRVVLVGENGFAEVAEMLSLPGEAVLAATAQIAPSLMKLERPGVRILTLDACGGRPGLRQLMSKLAAMDCLSVLIEGGGEVAASALEERVVDKVVLFYAPKIIGGRGAVGAVGGLGAERVADAISIERTRLRRFGDDFAVEGYVTY